MRVPRPPAARPAAFPAALKGDDIQRAVTAAEVAHAPDDVMVWNQDAEVDADRGRSSG